ncbi:Pro-apoptotic serine protease [Fulvia fulva]|uniref:Pro-apoptotic serine protease NMA111 n=1 Tax=Passalora fulva TaxID=5499 RepID=A0A9Q8PGL3_PASFU|nr:Pro-apoptotic serine protease [Fulvia fulva]KAK4613531.1 Pro-apoptotic serine protease [Fulvia fulva]KAK4615052.1 Pro-apoptotic serine protease [Fulvia fulva]UJO22051.1 Pro-apoptotic serine protease [Fulvia fulva]WPV19818.1 Pro-apoptotic serine protease [Fulvia fulva]WPV35163.1 Pro-apoptotic serine protease [Fulvia fulva]
MSLSTSAALVRTTLSTPSRLNSRLHLRSSSSVFPNRATATLLHHVLRPLPALSRHTSLCSCTSRYHSASASRLPFAFFKASSTARAAPSALTTVHSTFQQHAHFTRTAYKSDAMDHAATKRKQPPTSSASDRPSKQVRRPSPAPMENGTKAVGNGVPASAADTPNGYGSPKADEEGGLVHAAAGPDTAEWQATTEKVVRNVVSIHFCQTCSFDTDSAISSEATGFVVDAERGYILTNRHVVGAGPFWGYCIFDNHEECDVYPVYRDPVHDFGILRFDPKAVKYMQLNSLELRPDLAKVGTEIRVVGNDAGEKLSILSGVISRLDRNAPEYGEGYSDFNTNYIQAAAAASGGSSGSPVVNIDGFAVALQAGGRADGAATDYFLPLDRPLRALQRIREGKHVDRGTIQTQWILKPFDECRRLGLTSNWEAEVRKQFPKETGMLVAEVVLPKGPGDSKLEEGDVLVKVNGELLTQFVRLDDILDSSVDGKVKLLIQRGGVDQETELNVEDLHAITPDRFVSVAGASFHELSYQQARLYAIALKDPGVYCCEASGSFRFEGSEYGWLIQSIDNKPTPNLTTFIEVMKSVADRSRVVVTYKHLRDMHTLNTSIMLVDRHWNKSMRLVVRNDTTGLWDFSDLADPLPPQEPVPRKANFIKMEGAQHPAAVEVIRSFVRVSTMLPLKLDGFPKARKIGFGLVIDAEKGLVVVSRAIVPYDMCDISITIADSIIVDGKVVFLHPLQNYAIIQYDPSLVQAPVRTAKLADKPIKQGENTIFFGFNQNLRPVVAKTAVTDITTVAIPASASTPRYRAVNLDAITVDTSLSGQCSSGVLVAEDGTVQALWLNYLGERSGHSGKDVEYHLGFATPALLPVIDEVKSGRKPNLRILNLETQTVQMSQCRIMGVSEKWIERVERDDPERHQLFMVRKVDAGNVNGLQEGDIILTLNDKLVTRVSDLDIMYNNETLRAKIVRKQEEMELDVPTVPTEELETDQILVFCGAVLHRPHHAVRQQISKVHSDIYVSARFRGSPAYAYGLAPTNFILAVNAVPTPDVKSLIGEVNKIPDNTYFRLKVMTFDNVPWVATMKKNEHYFPTVEFVKDSSQREGWKRVMYEGGKKKVGEGELMPEVLDEGGASVEVDDGMGKE